MMWLFISLALCELKASDPVIRLPFRDPQSDMKPNYTISFNKPNVHFKVRDKEYIQLVPHGDGVNTSLNIIVEHAGPLRVATYITATWGKEEINIEVYIDEIARVSIKSISTLLYLSSYYKFSLIGYDKFDNTFSSLEGVEISWDPKGSKDSFNIVGYQLTTFTKKREYNSLKYLFIQPKETDDVVLTASIKNGPSAKKVLHLFRPIIFHPDEYYLLPGSTTDLQLCNAIVNSQGQIVQQCEPENIIDLSTVKDIKIINSNTTVSSVTPYGHVTALKKGRSTIYAKDTDMDFREASANIHVSHPATGKWPEQWIKMKPKKWPTDDPGPYEPTTDTITLYNKRGIQLISNGNPNWELVGDYESEGSHTVTAHLREYDFSVASTVHTCKKPKIKPSKVKIPLHHDNYQIFVKHGSGYFDYKVKNTSVLTLTPDHRIITKAIGKTKIVVYDQKIPDFKAKAKIYIRELSQVIIDLPYREFYVGDKIVSNISATYVGKDGEMKKFDYVQESSVFVEDESIVDRNLICQSVGFSTVQFSVGNVRSEKVMVSVIDKLNVRSPITGTSLKWLNLNRNGGPNLWPDGTTQYSELKCGEATPILNNEGNMIMFKEDYDGECILSVQNERSEHNPHPILAQKTFKVISKAITHLGLFVIDPNTISPKECGFVTNEKSESYLTSVTIPVNHTLQGYLYAYGKDDEELGPFDDPALEIKAIGKSGKEYQISLNEFQVYEDMTITISEPEIPNYVFNIHVIYPHYLSEDELPFVLYNKEKNPINSQIIEGSGNFQIIGNNVNLNGERELIIYPNSETKRTIQINDICIPENQFKFDVYTEAIGSLTIEGPRYGVIGQRIQLKTILLSVNSQPITPKSFDLITWACKPDNLTKVDKNHWEIVPQKPGRINIEIWADDIRSTHDIDIYSNMIFPTDFIKTFVNDKTILKVIGGPDNTSQILFISNDTNVVEIKDENIAISLRPGNATIKAIVPEKPEMGTCELRIRVLEAKELILEMSTYTPYVDSYVKIIPLIDTDDGIVSARSVSWNVDGNDKWEKLYDNSLMIQGEKEGYVIITALTPHSVSKTIKIYFDYKLELNMPNHLLLPIGAHYDIKVQNNLPVNYSIQTIEGSDVATVNDDGLLTINSIGRFVIIIKYKQQWRAVSVTASIPSSLYLQSQASSTLYPRLLDIDGQEYTGKKNIDIKPNVTYPYLISGGSYAFTIPSDVTTTSYVAFNASYQSEFNLMDTSLLFPYKLIHPQNPTIQRGATIQFICHSKQQYWRSLNERVATVTDGGYVYAVKSGKSIIQCSPDIDTPIRVVDFEAVSLEKVSKTLYKIVSQLSDNDVDPSTLQYSDDMSYLCQWDATECGSVKHITMNNSHYCLINFYDRRLCPLHSNLQVLVESPKASLKLKGVIDYKYKYDLFGIPSTFNVSLTDKEPFVDFKINPSIDEIYLEVPKGIVRTFRDNHTIRITALKEFTGPGFVVLEHKEKGERVRITVVRGKSRWSSIYLDTRNVFLSKFLLYASVFITFVFISFYVYKLGAGELNFNYTPYKPKLKRQ
ncbi:putative nuclear pore protein [Histomonas meleagridis]|uniref:putative nuclear pore protein n=1 Tax=Histomonas meleagridis TaxID=135588 RepID=UPI003559A071|nr:putative nuclear pore protein [Histomonas meleagridis]KAH0796922.1 putative nuclear pore protein [Histomonas meleagridis]